MSDSVIVTGAGSPLGKSVLGHLLRETDCRVAAVISPRTELAAFSENPRLSVFQADLTEKLPENLAALIHKADAVFHFAWNRGLDFQDVEKTNAAMIDQIMKTMEKPSRFYFISSVAASERARSTYGRVKQAAADKVRKQGGSTLVVGLVISVPPQGPFKMLVNAAKKLPLEVRFSKQGVPLYGVAAEDVGVACLALKRAGWPSGTFKVFGMNLCTNDFMKMLESKYKRFRLPLPVSENFLLQALPGLSRIPCAPRGLFERLQTFLFKDTEILKQLEEIPGMHYRLSSPETLQQFLERN